MVYEGVSFDEEKVKADKRDVFVKKVVCHWRNRPKEEQIKLAEQVYDLICGKPKKKKNEAE